MYGIVCCASLRDFPDEYLEKVIWLLLHSWTIQLVIDITAGTSNYSNYMLLPYNGK